MNETITYQEAMNEYLEELEEDRDEKFIRTQRKYLTIAQAVIRPNKLVSKISSSQIYRLYHSQEVRVFPNGEFRSTQSIYRMFRIFDRFINWLIQMNYLSPSKIAPESQLNELDEIYPERRYS